MLIQEIQEAKVTIIKEVKNNRLEYRVECPHCKINTIFIGPRDHHWATACPYCNRLYSVQI